MSCHEIEKELSAYLDGELPPKEADRVREHIAKCPACARELERLRRVIETMRELPAVPAPKGLKEKILDELVASETGREKPAGASRMRMLWPTAAAVAVAALLAWYGGLFRSRGVERAAAPTREVARLERPASDAALKDEDAGESAGRAAKMGAYRAPAKGVLKEKTPTIGAMVERGKAPPTAKLKVVTGKGVASKGGVDKGGEGIGAANGLKLSETALKKAPAGARAAKAGSRIVLARPFTGGTWELLSADPAATRARVTGIVKQVGLRVVAPPERRVAEFMQRRAAGPSPMVIEVTGEQWAKLVAALKKVKLTPVRELRATQVARQLERRETGDKLRGLHGSRPDKREKASFDLKTESLQTKASPAGEQRVRARLSAPRQRVERFRVRLLFRPANAAAVQSPARPHMGGEAETERAK